MKVTLSSNLLEQIKKYPDWYMELLKPVDEQSSVKVVRLSKDNHVICFVTSNGDTWESISGPLHFELQSSEFSLHLSKDVIDELIRHPDWDMQLLIPSLQLNPEISQFVNREIRMPTQVIRFLRNSEPVSSGDIDDDEFSDRVVEHFRSFDGIIWTSSEHLEFPLRIRELGFEVNGAPIDIDGGVIDMVTLFNYIGVTTSESCEQTNTPSVYFDASSVFPHIDLFAQLIESGASFNFDWGACNPSFDHNKDDFRTIALNMLHHANYGAFTISVMVESSKLGAFMDILLDAARRKKNANLEGAKEKDKSLPCVKDPSGIIYCKDHLVFNQFVKSFLTQIISQNNLSILRFAAVVFYPADDGVEGLHNEFFSLDIKNKAYPISFNLKLLQLCLLIARDIGTLQRFKNEKLVLGIKPSVDEQMILTSLTNKLSELAIHLDKHSKAGFDLEDFCKLAYENDVTLINFCTPEQDHEISEVVNTIPAAAQSSSTRYSHFKKGVEKKNRENEEEEEENDSSEEENDRSKFSRLK